MLIENARCTAETEKAILVEADSLDESLWVPKSQVTDDSEVYKKDTDGDLIVNDWWAFKAGLEG